MLRAMVALSAEISDERQKYERLKQRRHQLMEAMRRDPSARPAARGQGTGIKEAAEEEEKDDTAEQQRDRSRSRSTSRLINLEQKQPNNVADAGLMVNMDDASATDYSGDEFASSSLPMGTQGVHTTTTYKNNSNIVISNDIQFFSDDNRIAAPISSTAKPSLAKTSSEDDIDEESFGRITK